MLRPEFTAGIKIAIYLGRQSRSYKFVYKIDVCLYTKYSSKGKCGYNKLAGVKNQSEQRR